MHGIYRGKQNVHPLSWWTFCRTHALEVWHRRPPLWSCMRKLLLWFYGSFKRDCILIFNGNKVNLWNAFQGYNTEILGLLQIKCLVIIVCMEIRLGLWPHTANYEKAAGDTVDFVQLACGSGARKLFTVQMAPLTWLSYHCPALMRVINAWLENAHLVFAYIFCCFLDIPWTHELCSCG